MTALPVLFIINMAARYVITSYLTVSQKQS